MGARLKESMGESWSFMLLVSIFSWRLHLALRFWNQTWTEDGAVIKHRVDKHDTFCLPCHREPLYLNADFWQVDLHGQLLPAVDIRVVGLLEGPLQLMELIGGEGGAVSPVLLLRMVVVSARLRGTLVVTQVLRKVTHPLLALVPREKA